MRILWRRYYDNILTRSILLRRNLFTIWLLNDFFLISKILCIVEFIFAKQSISNAWFIGHGNKFCVSLNWCLYHFLSNPIIIVLVRFFFFLDPINYQIVILFHDSIHFYLWVNNYKKKYIKVKIYIKIKIVIVKNWSFNRFYDF